MLSMLLMCVRLYGAFYDPWLDVLARVLLSCYNKTYLQLLGYLYIVYITMPYFCWKRYPIWIYSDRWKDQYQRPSTGKTPTVKLGIFFFLFKLLWLLSILNMFLLIRWLWQPSTKSPRGAQTVTVKSSVSESLFVLLAVVPQMNINSPIWYCWNNGQEVFQTLQWRHNGCDGVSNHQPHDCLLNRLFRRRSKKKSQLHWPLCREFSGDRWIPRTKGQ